MTRVARVRSQPGLHKALRDFKYWESKIHPGLKWPSERELERLFSRDCSQ